MQRFIPKNIGPDLRGAGPELVLGRAIIEDYSDSRVLDRLMLYERRIESSLHKNIRELERQQLIRQYQQKETEQELEPSPSLRDEAATRKSEQFQLAPSTTGGSITDLKKQTQSQPSAGNPKSEYLNPKQVKKDTELKKQSQFPETNISAYSLEKGDYDKITVRGAQENKANQTRPENVERSQFDIKGQTKGVVNGEKLPPAANSLAG